MSGQVHTPVVLHPCITKLCHEMHASWCLFDSNDFTFVPANVTKLYYFSLNALHLWWPAFYCDIRDSVPVISVDCLEELRCS